jgi:hypothetical protein
MIDSETREAIKNNPLLKPLYEKVNRFDLYLEMARRSHIFVRQIRYLDYNRENDEDGNPVAEDIDLGYLTRWSEPYRNKILWKLYNFKGYYERYPEELPKYSLMVTLTGKHDGKDGMGRLSLGGLGHIKWNEKLWHANKKYRNLSRQYFPENNNLSMWEGHPTSGFSHIHKMYFFDELPGESALKLVSAYWTDTLKMGSRERAIELKIKDVRGFGDITSLVGYPMAYIGKNTVNGVKDWTAEDWVFNASIYWSGKEKLYGGIGHCIRTFQPSFGMSKIMSKDWMPGSEAGYPKPFFIDSRYKDLHLYDASILNTCDGYENNLEYWKFISGEDIV